MDKTSHQMIAGAVLLALLLCAALVFWKKQPGTPAAPAAQTGAGAQEQHHADEEGIVPMSAQKIKTAGVTLASAGPASVGSVVELPGEVRFNEDRTAHIVPRVPGVAESVTADLGQSVKQGQVLAVIASSDLAELRSAALAAQKRLALARLTYEREKKLWQDQISAEQDYLQAQQAYREAEIQAQTTQSKLSALGAGNSDGQLNRYVLRAPFDGIIVEKHIALGEAVKEDANVFLLSDLSSVWVDVVVTPKDLENVRVGADVTVKSTATTSSVAGKISYVGNLVGEQTRTSKARVVIANPQLAWRPGLFVNVAMVRDKKDVAVAVLAEAIQTVEGKTVVFAKVGQGFKALPVSTGSGDGRLVEITGGLTAGTAYAATGSFVVKAEQGKGSAEHEH